MPAPFPQASRLDRAIAIYQEHAYAGSDVPATVRDLLGKLRSGGQDYASSQAFVKSGEPAKLSLRLGNRFYPHMKLVLEPAPDGQSYLYRADTHDRHICPPAGHPEHAAFMQLRQDNQKLATEIEQAWAAEGFPTFRTYLERDLARRRGASPRHSP